MQVKSAERLVFDFWLRTGRRLADEEATEERKFNPWHDPDNGRFTFANHGKYFPRGGGRIELQARNNSQQPIPSRPTRPRATPSQANSSAPRASTLGSLSEKYEAVGRDPGTVSIPRGDPGGVSYGSYQLASRTGTLGAFMASPEFRPWSRKFAKLQPGTAAFNRQWRAEAARDPDAFRDAQRAYIMRTHYEPAISKVVRSTGYDLNRASGAVRETAFSVSVQHGRADVILSDAVTETDTKLKRTDASYERELIVNIYARRIAYVTVLRNQARTRRRFAQAQQFENIINNRYPNEQADALRLLQGP